MKRFLKEFKDFALRGNVMELAIAVVIGGAFSAIVKSLVDDIITPLIGVLIGGKGVVDWSVTVGTAVVKYGNFIQVIINFVIIAFSLFVTMRIITKVTEKINLLKKEEEKAAEAAKQQEVDVKEELLKEIRDLLKEKR